MKSAFLFLAALAAAGAASAATPVTSGSNAPINISSDSFQADLNGKTGTWAGNVVVVQGDMKMRSNQVHVSTVSGKPDKVIATGNVVVDSPKSGIVTGDNGVYSVVPRTVLMTGNVTLKKDKNVLTGTQLTVNLNTGQAILGSAKSTTPGTPASGGRVKSVLFPSGN